MPVANVIMRALTDERINSAIPLKALGLWGWHADDTGTIHPTDDGQQVTDPTYVARHLGISRGAAFKAFSTLHDLGYIEWQKAAFGAERRTGVTGRVRILVSAQ